MNKIFPNNMIHLDLFSGIGGFSLAVDEVWPGSTHIFCEIDPYCQALLKKRFEGSVIYGDIRRLTADTNRSGSGTSEIGTDSNRSEKDKGWQEQPQPKPRGQGGIDILTGGFPCQPFSQAGKRRGTSDNRFLWPKMLRVIREFKPTWVIAENVRGLLTIEQGVVFEQVCLDLEREDYETQPHIIPACAVNAPHRRDRVWFVAYRKGVGQYGWRGNGELQSGQLEQDIENDGNEIRCEIESSDTVIGNSQSAGQQSGEHGQREMQYGRTSAGCNKQWDRNWLEVATELCGVDDGLPAELDGLKLSKSKHRIERLRALGNAIVPQVAVEIMKAIKYADEHSKNLPNNPDCA